MVSTGVGELDHLLKDGYPEKSAILVVGPPGIGKEALGYWFTQAGLSQGDFCLYVTRLAVSEIIQDVKAFGAEIKKPTVWFAEDSDQRAFFHVVTNRALTGYYGSAINRAAM